MVSQFPFGQDFVVLRDAMNQLLEESFVPARAVATAGAARWRGHCLWTSTPRRRRPWSLPRCRGCALSIWRSPTPKNTLMLSGSVPTAAESEQGKAATWYLQELWHGQFQRTVTLPFEVDAGRAEASFENGIVRITLPKAERAKPQKIAIRAAGAQQEAIGAGSSD